MFAQVKNAIIFTEEGTSFNVVYGTQVNWYHLQDIGVVNM